MLLYFFSLLKHFKRLTICRVMIVSLIRWKPEQRIKGDSLVSRNAKVPILFLIRMIPSTFECICTTLPNDRAGLHTLSYIPYHLHQEILMYMNVSFYIFIFSLNQAAHKSKIKIRGKINKCVIIIPSSAHNYYCLENDVVRNHYQGRHKISTQYFNAALRITHKSTVK